MTSALTLNHYLIVSGFMESEDAVLPALEQFLELKTVDQEDEWRCAVFAAQSAFA